MKFSQSIRIGKKKVGPGHPTYIIAEVGSNFDGSLERAKRLAKMCKEAGADAFKIQNFSAPKIVSEAGFKNLKVAFQAKWKKPVVEVYRAAEFPHAWIGELAEYCRTIDIEFLSSPYDVESVDALKRVEIAAYKIGAGEIDNLEFISYVAKIGKPVILSAGAATLKETETALRTVRDAGNDKVVLLQCTTNYPSPMRDTNLKAMVVMRKNFGVVTGHSDHTIGVDDGGDDPLNGILVPIGVAALGGSVIEKHVTDDRSRTGPDHPFAITMDELNLMVRSVRSMEAALGDGKKQVMPSEKKTVIIQRRGMYAARDIEKGERIERDMIVLLRPAVGLRPHVLKRAIGKRVRRSIRSGQPIKAHDILGL